jgi:hypothetical protein
MRGYCLAGFSLVGKFQTKAKMTECDKHIGLLLYRIDSVRKKVLQSGLRVLYNKSCLLDWGKQSKLTCLLLTVNSTQVYKIGGEG